MLTPNIDNNIYEVPVDDLKTLETNPRVGDAKALAESLTVNGQFRPIVVRKETMEILAGNHTWQAAVLLGWKTIKVTYVENITDEQATRIILADNRYNDIGKYNLSNLNELLTSLDDLLGTGYDDAFLLQLIEDVNVEADPEDFIDKDASADTVETVAQYGDVWELGGARLIVGKAKPKELLQILKDSTLPTVIVSDLSVADDTLKLWQVQNNIRPLNQKTGEEHDFLSGNDNG
jgi:hypothetical protein